MSRIDETRPFHPVRIAVLARIRHAVSVRGHVGRGAWSSA